MNVSQVLTISEGLVCALQKEISHIDKQAGNFQYQDCSLVLLLLEVRNVALKRSENEQNQHHYHIEEYNKMREFLIELYGVNQDSTGAFHWLFFLNKGRLSRGDSPQEFLDENGLELVHLGFEEDAAQFVLLLFDLHFRSAIVILMAFESFEGVQGLSIITTFLAIISAKFQHSTTHR